MSERTDTVSPAKFVSSVAFCEDHAGARIYLEELETSYGQQIRLSNIEQLHNDPRPCCFRHCIKRAKVLGKIVLGVTLVS